MNKVARILAQVLFGEYNGIQVFLAPVTLFYWIDGSSILSAGTSLLNFRVHFFPLLVFMIIFAYTAFMMTKLKLFHTGSQSDYIDTLIDMNISVLALVLIALIVFAIASFLAYFYGIRETVRPAMYLLFKLYTSILIFYYFFVHQWLKRFYQRGYGRDSATKALKAWIRKNQLGFIRYSVLLIAIVLAAIRLYQIMISYIIDPILSGFTSIFGFNPHLHLVPFIHNQDVFINVAVCCVAFVMSNLLFFPIIFIMGQLLEWLHPDKLASNPPRTGKNIAAHKEDYA